MLFPFMSLDTISLNNLIYTHIIVHIIISSFSLNIIFSITISLLTTPFPSISHIRYHYQSRRKSRKSSMGRAPCCDKANVKKGPWSPEEDDKLKSYIEQNGTGGNWIALPQKIGLKRCGKSCRLRWLNYLRPNIRHGGFSEEEDNIICSLYISIGSRWSIIAAQLPGRTDNDIKNYWNTRLKKKLLGKQRREHQHHHQARRSISGLGQENNSMMAMNKDFSYWPELPVLSPIPYSNQDSKGINDHTSIRRLLMNLGGKFSTSEESNGSMEQLVPINNNMISNSSPNTIYSQEGSTNGYMVSSSMDTHNNNTYQYEHPQFSLGVSGMDMLQGLEHQAIEIGQLGFTSSSHGMVDGLEFFNGSTEELYNNRNVDESMTFSDMLARSSSSVYNHTQEVQHSSTNIYSYDQQHL